MPTKVYNNVEGHKVIDNKRTCEDVTKVGLPVVKHSSTTIKAAGMAVDVDMPDTTHLEPMEFTITHNNGVNCQYLANPGKHTIEVRLVRQRYNVPKGVIEHELEKYRVIGVHMETQEGDVETGSPIGSTEKYSVLRYEKEVNGKNVILADAMTGDIKYNGKSYTEEVEKLLK